MVCPHAHGDNPQVLVSGLSPVQVGNHGITFYTMYISVDLAHFEMVSSNVGKGGIRAHFEYA